MDLLIRTRIFQTLRAHRRFIQRILLYVAAELQNLNLDHIKAACMPLFKVKPLTLRNR